MDTTVLSLAIVAAAMAVATAYLIHLIVDARSRAQGWTGMFLLAMMGEMWVAAVVYWRAPSSSSLLAGLAVSGLLMVLSLVPLVVGVGRSRRNGTGATSIGPGPVPLSLGMGVGLSTLVLANEFLMSWGLLVATGGFATSSGAVPAFASVVNSPWFLFTMAGEMLLSAVLLRHRLPRVLLAILLVQAVIMGFSPTALAGASWPAVAIVVSSALMIGLFVYLFEFLYRHRQFAPALGSYLVALVSVYGLMMAGLFVWQYFGNGTTFAIAVVLEMLVVYLALACPNGFHAKPGTPWQLRPHWTFALLSGVFVAEVCMGAVLSVQLDPGEYLAGFPFLPLAGAPGTVLLNAVSNGFWFFATAAASSWFLIMMGLEMGALVVFKIRESKNLENRIRLGLMIGCYAAFTVFYPSIYFALAFPNAPNPNGVTVLGWPMGIGSFPLAAGVFGVVLATYIVLGSLTALFGRRVVCSVFCSAPLMYQGTAIDAMKSFNRSSPVARKYLSSRLSGAYSFTMGAVLLALFGTSLLSYLDSVGAAHVYIEGTDPSVFFFIASFSVAWYVLFVAIPYAGNYNCVTMGWCYTGVISAAFQKIGTFKLKVRDKDVCRACTTLDCAKGCPVGLVDMPGHFRQTGEFRSTKCCGVGDCVEDCPYDNLYISDVRHSIRRLLGRPETRPRRASSPAILAPKRTVAAAGAVPFALTDGAVLLPMAKPGVAPFHH
jgi:polyferredoxin